MPGDRTERLIARADLAYGYESYLERASVRRRKPCNRTHTRRSVSVQFVLINLTLVPEPRR